jgi:aminocarboxymuconate-semialdehyde decarboxylase
LGDLKVGSFIEEMDLDRSTKEDIFHNAALEWLNIKKERFE